MGHRDLLQEGNVTDLKAISDLLLDDCSQRKHFLHLGCQSLGTDTQIEHE